MLVCVYCMCVCVYVRMCVCVYCMCVCVCGNELLTSSGLIILCGAAARTPLSPSGPLPSFGPVRPSLIRPRTGQVKVLAVSMVAIGMRRHGACTPPSIPASTLARPLFSQLNGPVQASQSRAPQPKARAHAAHTTRARHETQSWLSLHAPPR